MEVRLVDEDGHLDPQGQWAWVEQVEVNPRMNSRELFRYFMAYGAQWLPSAKWCYWLRKGKTGQRIHGPFSRQRIEQNLVKGGRRDVVMAS